MNFSIEKSGGSPSPAEPVPCDCALPPDKIALIKSILRQNPEENDVAVLASKANCKPGEVFTVLRHQAKHHKLPLSAPVPAKKRS